MRWKLFFAGLLLGTLAFQTLTTNAEQRDALAVPFATQFDGSPFAATDCGPASVAMAINYATGEHLTPLQARQAIVKLPGGGYAANAASGTAIGDLARVARTHKVDAFMGDGAASTGWGPERIRNHLSQGHPVIVLTRIGYLPGYNTSTQVDHYIILTGANNAGYVYNDPALGNGARRTITEKQLQLAQRMASVPGQGAAFSGPPGATTAAAAQAQPAGPTTQVTVARGDTLSQLAQQYGVELQQVVALNRGAVSNIDHIEVGQVLKFPQQPIAEPKPSTDPTPAPASNPKPAAEPASNPKPAAEPASNPKPAAEPASPTAPTPDTANSSRSSTAEPQSPKPLAPAPPGRRAAGPA